MNQQFSIIIPLYNKGKTITKTLDSVTNIQGFEYEVVVVDDGSTDEGPDIVAAYPSNRVKLFRKPNGGVSSARNYGAMKATKQWLIFLDADDLLLPDCLEIYSKLIERYPNDEVFVGNHQQMQGNTMVTMYCKKEFVSENPHRDIWYSLFYLQPGSFCCSSHAFQVSGGYDERMSYNEDFEYCMRIAGLFRMVVTPEIVLEYVTEQNEGRVKVHPLNKNFAYYLPSMNLTNRFVRNKYYNALCSAENKYKQVGDYESANLLKEIKQEKFGKSYSIIAWCYYHFWVNIRRYRLVKDSGLIAFVNNIIKNLK